MSSHEAVIERFYRAFQQRDAATMGACYHDAARFSDPVFPALDAEGVRAMWAMLCARGKDLRIEFSDVRSAEATGSAHWEAHYRFSGSGRPVHNRVNARFGFRDGLIVEHVDVFDFPAWSAQALGLPGRLLGRTGFLQRKVQQQAAASLADWRARAASAGGGAARA